MQKELINKITNEQKDKALVILLQLYTLVFGSLPGSAKGFLALLGYAYVCLGLPRSFQVCWDLLRSAEVSSGICKSPWV